MTNKDEAIQSMADTMAGCREHKAVFNERKKPAIDRIKSQVRFIR